MAVPTYQERLDAVQTKLHELMQAGAPSKWSSDRQSVERQIKDLQTEEDRLIKFIAAEGGGARNYVTFADPA